MKRVLRAIVAMTLILTTVVVGSVAPAGATGSLTGTSFTTGGTGYAVTGASNTRYDWGFTTATASNLNRVSMSVPAGTTTTGQKYLDMNANGYASTPDSVANSLTGGDLDFRAKVREANWNQTGYQTFLGKLQISTYMSYWFGSYNGSLAFFWNNNVSNGTVYTTRTSTAPIPFANNSTGWMRMTMNANSGGNTVLTFYTSTDGTNWTPLGTTQTVTGTSTALYDSPAVAAVGTNFSADGTTQVNQLTGSLFFTSAANGITGTTSTSATTCGSTGVAICFNPTDQSGSSSSWTSSSTQAEPWSVTRGSTLLQADISADLTPLAISGVTAGGTANLRYIDGQANYYFAGTSIASGTPCTIALGGFINSAPAGSYSSGIFTDLSNSTIDSGNTGTLTFGPAANNTTASATIDPTMTFTLAGRSGTCNGATITGTATATSVNLGHINSSTEVTGAQDIGITTNAGGHAALFTRFTGAMNDGNGHVIASIPGTGYSANAQTFSANGTAGFGYAYGFQSGLWQPLLTTNISNWATSTSPQTVCIVFRAQSAPTTPAGAYSATVVYTAVPYF